MLAIVYLSLFPSKYFPAKGPAFIAGQSATGIPGPIYGFWCLSLSYLFADLTDVTLADGDTKSILTDNAKRAIQGNVAMHVTHPVNLVVKF